MAEVILAVVILGVLSVVGCRGGFSGPSSADLDAAAMEALWPLPRVIPGPYHITQYEIDVATARVETLRAWVNTAPELSSEEKRAYRGWLDFCEKDNKRAQRSLDTNERQRFEARMNAEATARAVVIERTKIHKPPADRAR